MGALDRVRAPVFFPRRRRAVWSSGRRVHIEVRSGPGGDTASHAVVEGIARLDGVDWADWDAAAGHVVAAFDADMIDVGQLTAAVEEIERTQGLTEPFDADPRTFPDDGTPIAHNAVALGANAAALGLAVAGRLARIARVPVEIASLIPLVQSQHRLRRGVERVVGPTPAEFGLSLANAAVQGLAQGPLGLVVDGVTRVSQLGESLSRQAAWRRVEPHISESELVIASGPLPARPVPLPAGPVERYADKAGLASLGGFGLLLVAGRDIRRAAAGGLVTMPKAALHGRDVFAAHLGRLFAARDILCLDPEVLRRLDRIDCVMIEASLLSTGAKSVRDVHVVGDADKDEVLRRLRQLLERAAGQARRGQGGWRLRPVDESRGEALRPEVRRWLAQLDRADVVALTLNGELIALAKVDEELHESAVSIVHAARRAGYMVVIAGDAAYGDRLGANLVFGPDKPLTDAVQMLQADGCVVALVCGDDATALHMSDCGIGVMGEVVPWNADILAGDLEAARLLIDAAGVAHEVSRQSVALALGGTSLGSIMALTVPAPGAAGRAMTAVNVATLLAQANAVRAAVSLNRRPTPPSRSQPPWHELDPSDVLARLATSAEGLDTPEAKRRFVPEEDGREPTLPAAVVRELFNPLTPVLAGGAAVSAVVGSTVDAFMVGGVVALNGVLGGGQRFQVERAVRALDDRTKQRVRVRRDGVIDTVPVDSIVAGDVVHLEAGDSVPADCRVLEAQGLEADESSVTGESIPVGKDAAPTMALAVAERSSMLWEGTAVAVGSAEAVVVATGADTETGRAQARTDRDQTPKSTGVEARLRDLAHTADLNPWRSRGRRPGAGAPRAPAGNPPYRREPGGRGGSRGPTDPGDHGATEFGSSAGGTRCPGSQPPRDRSPRPSGRALRRQDRHAH